MCWNRFYLDDVSIRTFLSFENSPWSAGINNDFLEINYADSDKIFLPVENIELISPLGLSDAKLDKLGSANWQMRKATVKNKIKLIYSATSASLGNNGKDKDLSPYAFTKTKNLELLENLKKWFNQ